MATHDVDQKLLGRLAKRYSSDHPLVSRTLYRILGISVLLARRLVRARTVRKVDSSRDTKSLAMYHHIVFLSKEGCALLETHIIPYAGGGQLGQDLRIFAAKLRASFYHVFCLFHNQPPVSQQLNITPHASPRQATAQAISPLSPRHGNGQKRRTSPRQGSPRQSANNGKENPTQPSSPGRTRKVALRETIPSMISDASYITNPYAAVSPPPGFNTLMPVPNPSNFLLPAKDYRSFTNTLFDISSKLSLEFLPGSSPLRLSVALEYCAFLWDCVHDHEGSRKLARRTIRDVYRAQEGMDDEEFQDSAILVGTLGRMMRRKSQDGTPRFGDITPPPRPTQQPGPGISQSTSANPRPFAPTSSNMSTMSPAPAPFTIARRPVPPSD